jgi:acyl-CoA dehydrogenase
MIKFYGATVLYNVIDRAIQGYERRDVPSEHVPARRAAAREKFAWLLDAAAVSS